MAFFELEGRPDRSGLGRLRPGENALFAVRTIRYQTRSAYGRDGSNREIYVPFSTRRPMFSSAASLFGGPISWRLVTGKSAFGSGMGTANAGTPA
jgi:hypothetical protein